MYGRLRQMSTFEEYFNLEPFVSLLNVLKIFSSKLFAVSVEMFPAISLPFCCCFLFSDVFIVCHQSQTRGCVNKVL